MSGTNGRNEERDVRHALGYLVSDEPPLGVGVESAVTEGRRLRRRHRTTRVVLPVAVLALVAVAGGATLVATDQDPTTRPDLTVAAAALPLTPAGRASLTDSSDVSTAQGRAMLAAVRDASPSDWRFALTESDIGVPTLDGTVDDGNGETRLMVSVSNTTGMFTVHPCQDSEYRAGASCEETTLADGSYLSVRGLSDYKGIKTYMVGVTRDDGTGVSIEAGNFSLPPQPGPGSVLRPEDKKEFGPGGKYGPVITRATPLYDPAALVAVVKAVASIGRDWPTEPMKSGGDARSSASATTAPR